MLWQGSRESVNVEDRRSFGTAGRLGIGGLVVGAVIVYLMGGDPTSFIAQNMNTMAVNSSGSSTPSQTPAEKQEKSFAAVVLGYTEDVWAQQFATHHQTYRAPHLVIFRRGVNTGCGTASSTTGPFYCPADQKVYLDLSFFDELSQRLGARGDTAAAYVIAHEVGHHVQNLLGIERVARANRTEPRNQISVQIELQADCLAGVWAKQIETTRQVIEPGDIDEAMNAASAVGDDRLQKRAQGYVVPDSFTHGSSAQRMAAFRRGYEGADLEACTR